MANEAPAIATLRGLPPSVTAIAREHSKSSVWAGACIAIATAVACGPAALPRPPAVQVVAEDYVAVPFTPRPPPVEILPERPKASGDLAWADGGWEWNGDRYRWTPGAWVAVPAGAKRARWVIVRREADGQLFFAPSTWRDASGKAIDPPKPLARASTRPGGAAAGAGGGPRGEDSTEPGSPIPTGTPPLDE